MTVDHPRAEVYEDLRKTKESDSLGAYDVTLRGGWRWRLRAANGEIIASGEAHTTRADAVRAFRRVAELAGEADVVTVEA